jgi:hypothetical protein
MAQNRSTAVMQRRNEAQDSLDDFPTPPWATRALLEHLRGMGLDLAQLTVREPCANRGYMARPLAEHFAAVEASDVHDYGHGFPVRDYLFGLESDWEPTDFTVMNPPFRLAEEFIYRALRLSRVGVAVIQRIAFIEGGDRYGSLWSKTPPSRVLQFVERVAMFKGRVLPPGADDWDNLDEQGNPKKASSATAYAWIIWLHGDADTRLRWIPPSRRQLEKPGDYPDHEARLEAMRSTATAGPLFD